MNALPLLLVALAFVVSPTMAFTVKSNADRLPGSSKAFSYRQNAVRAASALAMAPKFDKNAAKWIPSTPEEEASAGYDVFGSLLRQGPGPFFQRVFKAEDYDQAILKYMAGEGCSRDEAQASMDAYLRNPSDWQYNRLEEERTGLKRDYLTLKTDQIALTLVWSAIVISGVSRLAYALIYQEPYWSFIKAAYCCKACDCAGL